MQEKHEFRSIFCGKCGHSITFPVRCRERFCPTCLPYNAGRIRTRIKVIIDNTRPKHGYGWKFVTLTIPNVADVVAATDHIIKSFRRMRSRRAWSRLVDGGLYVIEVTRSADLFHVHLHALIFSLYFPVHSLSKLWLSCSGGKIVFIQAVYGANVVYYLTKYITKCPATVDLISAMNSALRNRRLFNCFGHAQALAKQWKRPTFVCAKCGSSDWTDGHDHTGYTYSGSLISSA